MNQRLSPRHVPLLRIKSRPRIVIARGDGVGKEVIPQAVRVLQHVAGKYGLDHDRKSVTVGCDSVVRNDVPITDTAWAQIETADAILFGACGLDPENLDRLSKTQMGKSAKETILRMRHELGLHINLRPSVAISALVSLSSLKRSAVSRTDLLVLREGMGGHYRNEEIWRDQVGGDSPNRIATSTEIYSEAEILKMAKIAAKIGKETGKKVVLCAKANAIPAHGLWREVFARVMEEEGVAFEYQHVDNGFGIISRKPNEHHIVAGTNLFGDIGSDVFAYLVHGSLGLAPSASLNLETDVGLYESVHGTAPQIAGQGIANPIASIWSVALMVVHTFGRVDIAKRIERAIFSALKDVRTPDIYREGFRGERVNCKGMADAIIERI